MGRGELANHAGGDLHGGVGHNGADGVFHHGHVALGDIGHAHGRGGDQALGRRGAMRPPIVTAQDKDQRGKADDIAARGAGGSALLGRSGCARRLDLKIHCTHPDIENSLRTPFSLRTRVPTSEKGRPQKAKPETVQRLAAR